jgi:hypothetical protein
MEESMNVMLLSSTVYTRLLNEMLNYEIGMFI